MEDWIESAVMWGLSTTCGMLGITREKMEEVLRRDGVSLEELKSEITEIVEKEMSRFAEKVLSTFDRHVFGLTGEITLLETKLAHHIATGCWMRKLKQHSMKRPDEDTTKMLKRIENLLKIIDLEIGRLWEKAEQIHVNNSVLS